jgi:hypothetical protein
MRALPIVLAAVLAVAAACSNARVQKPVQQRTAGDTTFPHSAHEDLDCTDCHSDVPDATKLGVAPLPTAEKCQECHDADADHTPPARAKRAEYTINFAHANHLPRVGKKGSDACKVCHVVLPEPGASGVTTPPMSTCTNCHYHQVEVAEARCTPCHVSLKRFRAEPISQFVEFSHTGNFIRKDHGRLAKNGAETCAQCHDQTYCATCHTTATLPMRPEIRFPENVRTDFIHRGDYVSIHNLDAARDPASCRKCHGSQFCESCHAVQGLARGLENDPHPPGWSGRPHAEAARRDIINCSGCHDQGASAVCIQCHTVGGIAGVNPHPGGWNHDEGDISKNSMCMACHTSGRVR